MRSSNPSGRSRWRRSLKAVLASDLPSPVARRSRPEPRSASPCVPDLCAKRHAPAPRVPCLQKIWPHLCSTSMRERRPLLTDASVELGSRPRPPLILSSESTHVRGQPGSPPPHPYPLTVPIHSTPRPDPLLHSAPDARSASSLSFRRNPRRNAPSLRGLADSRSGPGAPNLHHLRTLSRPPVPSLAVEPTQPLGHGPTAGVGLHAHNDPLPSATTAGRSHS